MSLMMSKLGAHDKSFKSNEGEKENMQEEMLFKLE